MLRFPKRFDVGALVGVASVMLTVGLVLAVGVGVVFPNKIGVSGFHVWFERAGGVLLRLAKGLGVFVFAGGGVFS